MDRITKSLLIDYQDQFQLENDREDKLFEMFCNYAITARFTGGEFEIQDVLTGGTNDSGIDGLAFVAAGKVMDSVDELSRMVKKDGLIPEIKIIFIQSKTSASFQSGDILKFWHGVKSFLEEDSSVRRNKDLKEKAEILRYITEHPLNFESTAVKLFYVTTGRYYGDGSHVLSSVEEKIVREIQGTRITDDVEMNFLGAFEIQQYYKQTQRKPLVSIQFERHTLLPEIEDIQQAYIGYLPLVELKKLLVDEEGELRKGIFYDNVRDFQGEENLVNIDIAKTLQSEKPDQLSVLNNGITIVAKKITQSRDTFHLQDYQIVNGCQTSHIIYRYLKRVDLHKIGLQVKLIVTENDQITNEVIKATNSQTPVKREELLALLNYQKQLEEYYLTFREESLRLYYERRKDQYTFVNEIKKVRIVTIRPQLKSFTAMFLEQPELAKESFESLIEQIDGRYFSKNHQHIVYYTAAFALYRLEYFFRNHRIDPKYRKFTFHLLMVLKYVINGTDKVPRLNSSKIEPYCYHTIHGLNSEQALDYVKKAIGIIEQVVPDLHDIAFLKSPLLTKDLKKAIHG